MAADALRKRSMRRLMFDQEELQNDPVENVSAAPLDENMFEWHCNIQQDDIIYHLLLFFPTKYPYDSPSAEFVPSGFRYNSGATKPGKKGTKICLNIFSDFADIHTEWKDQKGLGWSPGYTVQTVLMNVIAFLAETQDSDWAWMKDANEHNLKLSKAFKCEDCGHTYKKPFPPLDEPMPAKPKAKVPKDSKLPEIIDYISKDRFKIGKPKSRDELYGYGLVVSGPPHRPALTTPCEFVTGESYFGMQKSMGKVQSVMKEDIKYFLPLYIHPKHGAEIQKTFEDTMMELADLLPKCNRKKTPVSHMVLKTIPNLMSATVVDFSKGTQHTSENSLFGYFALHRLLLWAMETYTDLQDEVENRLSEFMKDESNRTKKACPHIGEWLLLLTASGKYRWTDAANAYLSESWRRNVMWYVKEDGDLGILDTPMEYRLENTLKQTAVSRKLLAFQVLFLDIAMPAGKTRKDLIKRYDDNLGFPTPEMVAEMKAAVDTINNMKTYSDWFKILKLLIPSDQEIYDRLVDAVKFAIKADGYHWTFFKTAGGWMKVYKKYPLEKKKKDEGEKKEGKEETESKGKGRGKKSAKEEEPKGKGKAPVKGKAPAKGRKKKVETESESEEEMDVEPPASKGRGRGRGVKRAAEEPKVGGRGRGGKKKK